MSITKQMIDLYESGLSCQSIADELNLPSKVYVHRRLVKMLIPLRPQGGRWPTHGQYRDGPIDNGNGYLLVRVEDNDPMASMRNHLGYVLEHRLVKAQEIGRPLFSTETVHHIDGDKLNNDPKNLQLRHGKHGNGTVMCCADCGSVNVIATAIMEN